MATEYILLFQFLVLDCCTEPHPICEADGTCLCFCLGMDYLPLYRRASFMVLIRFWSSLPTILKLSMLISWPDLMEWSYIGEGAFWCPLNLSAKVLADSPMYSSLHSTLSDVETSLEMHLYPKLLAWSFYAFTEADKMAKMAITSATNIHIPTSGTNNSHSGNNICHQPNTMAVTSANKNMAITSAKNTKQWQNICHKKEWQQHLP